MKFKSTLSCLLILTSIVATFSPISEVFCEKNSLQKNYEDVSSSIAEAPEELISSSLDPDIYDIDYPSSITLGESACIIIHGKNQGGDANEGDQNVFNQSLLLNTSVASCILIRFMRDAALFLSVLGAHS